MGIHITSGPTVLNVTASVRIFRFDEIYTKECVKNILIKTKLIYP
jgi:hypothetical protein